MSVRPFLDKHPQLGARVYVDPQGCVIGEVTLGEDASVWPMAVVRGDVNSIVIGARTNIQDAAVIHVTHEGPFTRVGGWPTVMWRSLAFSWMTVLRSFSIATGLAAGGTLPPVTPWGRSSGRTSTDGEQAGAEDHSAQQDVTRRGFGPHPHHTSPPNSHPSGGPKRGQDSAVSHEQGAQDRHLIPVSCLILSGNDTN